MKRVFARCPRLTRLGFAHGFGTAASHGRPPQRTVTVRQVHGVRMVRAEDVPGVEVDARTPDPREVEARPAADVRPEADALWAVTPGLAVGVLTADCLPLLMVVPDRGAVAAVHAGWRGSVAGIAERAAIALAEQVGISPAEITAVVGPHIGPCCYEVDEPVIAAVRDRAALGPGRTPDRAQLDLYTLNRIQLERAGLPSESILRVPGCTHCDPSFASYRRDRTPLRMIHYVRVPARSGAPQRVTR